jgi:hypothetical protein
METTFCLPVLTISFCDSVVSTAADGKEYTMLETGCNSILVDEIAFG